MADITNADLVNDWFRERLASGALARNTEAYNQVSGALPGLIALLDAADTALAPTPAPTLTVITPGAGPADKAAPGS